MITLQENERELTKFEEESLQDYLVDELREIGGIPITKDNCEDMFENWLGGLSWSEIDEIVSHYKKEDEIEEF